MSDVKEYKSQRTHGLTDFPDDSTGQRSHVGTADLPPPKTESDSREPLVDRSPYLVQRLLHSKDENLFNHVKFHLVKQCIDGLGLDTPRVLDVGCGLQVAKMYLDKLGLEFEYFGVDYEARFLPGAVVDLMQPESLKSVLPWKPNVVLMLDVLEHLHEDAEVLQGIVERLAGSVSDDCVFIFTLPQMYRLDRFNLAHLHYPEHKVRFQQHEWRHILEGSLYVEKTQGLGYLSVLPYLPMASKRYTPDNRLGRLFNWLRGTVFEWAPLKPLDLMLSNTLGKIPFCKTVSNDILFVARKQSLSSLPPGR